MRQGVPQDGAKLWHDSQLCGKGESTTMEGVKPPEGRAAEPEMKKPRVEAPEEDKDTEEEEKAAMA
jgi:hypothetical protein